MKCPNCGLVNPPSTMPCKCGYEALFEPEKTSNGGSSKQNAAYLVDRYFESPDPHRVPQALKTILNNPKRLDLSTNMTWYLFARIAQDEPDLIREYEQIFRSVPYGRHMTLKILEQAGDDQTREFLAHCAQENEFVEMKEDIKHAVESWSPGAIQPLERLISTAVDLDLLWCEFRATGNTQAVVRIIDVLERPDHIRGNLENWMRSTLGRVRPGFQWFGKIARRQIICRLWKKAGILCDGERCEVLSPQDLDCHCTTRSFNVDRDYAIRISKILPFSLDGENNYIFLKAVARWSLSSHALQFDVIRDLCAAEAEKRKGRCRILLLEILASIALTQGEMEKAFKALGDSLTPAPETEEKQRLKATAEFERLGQLSTAEAKPTVETPEELFKLALASVRATKAAETYRSMHLWIIQSDKTESKIGDVKLECQYARPHNFRVFQTMWWENGEVYDEWITTRNAHFRGPICTDFSHRANRQLNSRLLASGYFDILCKYTAFKAGRLKSEESTYVFLTYVNVPLPVSYASWWLRLFIPLGLFVKRSDVILWIDIGTKLLVKAVTTWRPSRKIDGTQQEITSLFSCYNEPVSIVPPAFRIFQEQPK